MTAPTRRPLLLLARALAFLYLLTTTTVSLTSVAASPLNPAGLNHTLSKRRDSVAASPRDDCSPGHGDLARCAGSRRRIIADPNYFFSRQKAGASAASVPQHAFPRLEPPAPQPGSENVFYATYKDTVFIPHVSEAAPFLSYALKSCLQSAYSENEYVCRAPHVGIRYIKSFPAHVANHIEYHNATTRILPLSDCRGALAESLDPLRSAAEFPALLGLSDGGYFFSSDVLFQQEPSSHVLFQCRRSHRGTGFRNARNRLYFSRVPKTHARAQDYEFKHLAFTRDRKHRHPTAPSFSFLVIPIGSSSVYVREGDASEISIGSFDPREARASGRAPSVSRHSGSPGAPGAPVGELVVDIRTCKVSGCASASAPASASACASASASAGEPRTCAQGYLVFGDSCATATTSQTRERVVRIYHAAFDGDSDSKPMYPLLNCHVNSNGPSVVSFVSRFKESESHYFIDHAPQLAVTLWGGKLGVPRAKLRLATTS